MMPTESFTDEQLHQLIPAREQETAAYLLRAAFRLLYLRPKDVAIERNDLGHHKETARWTLYYWAGHASGLAFRSEGNLGVELFSSIAAHSEDKNRKAITEFSRGFVDGLNSFGEFSTSYYRPADTFDDEDIFLLIRNLINPSASPLQHTPTR